MLEDLVRERHPMGAVAAALTSVAAVVHTLCAGVILDVAVRLVGLGDELAAESRHMTCVSLG